MNYRMSIEEAKRLGLIDSKPQAIKPTPQRKQLREATKKAAEYPQRRIFNRLLKSISDDIVWEKEGLVPGRKYRIDIFIPSTRIAIEFDGFQYHRSKDAFQKDRKRQNILALHDVAVLRYFAKQVLDDDQFEEVIKEIVLLHNKRKN